MTISSFPIRRAGSEAMCLITVAFVPSTLNPFRLAKMSIVVVMQVPSAVATRSVGENDSPFPPLSRGASV